MSGHNLRSRNKMLLDKDCIVKLMSNFACLSDVTLIAGLDQAKFPVPRCIIAQSSKCLQALLGPISGVRTEEKFVLKNVDGLTLEAVILFIYIGHIELNRDNIESILNAASSMEIIPLKQKCDQFLQVILSVQNCVKTLMLAHKYGLGQLKTNALKLVCAHFGNIPKADILQIDGHIFNELLQYEHFWAPESSIFECLIGWVGQKKAEGAKWMPELLKSIRLEYMTGEFIYSSAEPIFEQYGLSELIQKEYQSRFRGSQPDRLYRSTEPLAQWKNIVPKGWSEFCLRTNLSSKRRTTGTSRYRTK